MLQYSRDDKRIRCHRTSENVRYPAHLTSVMFGLLFVIATLDLGVFAETIQLLPEYVNVVENESVTLKCSKKNGQLVETSWTNSQIQDKIARMYYNGEKCFTTNFLRNNNLFDGICNGDGTYSVLLKTVDRTQFGAIWQCAEALQYSNEVTIKELVPVASVDIYTPTETYMKENHSQTIRCKPSACRPQPTIRWFLRSSIDRTGYNITDNTTQISSDNEDGLVVSEGLLYLLPNRSLNGWTLACEAWNNIQRPAVLSKEVPLNISFPPNGPPVITEAHNGNNYKIAEHKLARLSCTVSGGNPLANIVWFCLNGDISEVKESNTVTSSITWTALRNQQNTTCICVAEHMFGNRNTSVIVDILYKASVLLFYTGVESIMKNSFTVNQNDTITFSCIIDSKPPPNVTLYHYDMINHVTVFNNSLVYTKKNIQCSDIGMYVCSAENEYNKGTTSAGNLTLNVICAPRPSTFFELVENVNSPRYTSATMRFSALAFPEPGPSGFTWYYLNGSERIMLNDSHNVVISSLPSHSSLTIRNVTQSEYGQYFLRIINRVGVYEQKFNLNPFSSTICPNNVTNCSSAAALIAVGIGTSIATLIFGLSVLFVHRFMRRKPRLRQSIQGDSRRHMEETAPASTDNKTIAEYEQISMKPIPVGVSAVQNKETVSGSESAQHYDILDERRKETDEYCQLPELHQQKEFSRGNTEDASIDNNDTLHTIQDYINIKI